MDGMPFVLSEGEYLFVAPQFDDYIDSCYQKSGLDLEQPFFDHLTFPLSTPSKTKLGDTEITQSQFWVEGTIGGRRTKVQFERMPEQIVKYKGKGTLIQLEGNCRINGEKQNTPLYRRLAEEDQVETFLTKE